MPYLSQILPEPVTTVEHPYKDTDFIEQINLHYADIPAIARHNFTVDEIIKWVNEAIEIANKIFWLWKLFKGEKTVSDFKKTELQTIIVNKALEKLYNIK